MNCEIKTYITDEDLIVQEVLLKEQDTILERITEQIINTREWQVRLALIDLGWTPPKEVR